MIDDHKRRWLRSGVGCALLLPAWWIDGSGDQLGLGLYLAFVGVPIGVALLVYSAVKEPPGTHDPVWG